nr:hypothetical protein [Tanacetum cinerariifolium]
MAHVNFKTINKLAKHGLVEGLPLKLFTNEHKCVACNKGKQHKALYKDISAVRIISEPLKLLHMDHFGPTSIRSIDHKYYSLVVTDDFSRFSWAFFLETKDETFYILKDFIALIENQLNKKVKAIRCDKGTEFQNAKLIALYEEKGIKRDYKAVSTACYVLNRVSITNPHNKTPYELLFRKVPNIRHLKLFGCQVTILNTSDHLGKFEGKANDGFLVGYVAHSYTRFKTNPPVGTQDTNIITGTQDDDSESECDEQAILVPSFPSNSFSGSKVNDVSAPMETNLDYAKELARLQKQEHKAHSVAAKYGFEFLNETAEILHQADIETRRNLVLAVGDPSSSIVSNGLSAQRHQELDATQLIYNEADWMELMAKIANNSSKKLLGDDVTEDNMNERLGMLLIRKQRELAERSQVLAGVSATLSTTAVVSVSTTPFIPADESVFAAPSVHADTEDFHGSWA